MRNLGQVDVCVQLQISSKSADSSQIFFGGGINWVATLYAGVAGSKEQKFVPFILS